MTYVPLPEHDLDQSPCHLIIAKKQEYFYCRLATASFSLIASSNLLLGYTLLLNGENDTDTPVQQAFLLQQRLTEVNHPDHTLITYPNLGHDFYPSSKWSTAPGPIQRYVLADLYSWLEAHSGFTNHTATAAHVTCMSSSNSTSK
jgi:hypothetical protein